MSHERRNSKRIRTDHVFHATWATGEYIPPISEFFPVEAYDISRDGMALITDRFSIGERIVLLLGSVLENPVMVVGDVTHITAMRFGKMYLPVTGVGFTERISDELVGEYTSHADLALDTPAVETPSIEEKLW